MTLLPVVVSQVKHNSWFVAGALAGLWLALAVPLGEHPPCAAPPAPPPDEFDVVRETRPAGAAPGAGGAARSVQRPRYYTTELGMRAPLLAAILSSEDMLESRVAALNRTAGRLQPALRFFMAASAGAAAPRANVVAFTDTRQMLKPFHALKYLADNYLDDYDFFFLASDAAWVNARRLAQLVSRLSVSQDLHMGVPADDDSHYCSLEGGILISNSVLRAVQRALDWCVRNSYSPRHHENVGRCVLHAARVPCTPHALGERYSSMDVSTGELQPALADAVTARGVASPQDMYRLHAYVSRVYLERYQRQVSQLRGSLARLRRRAPPQHRNATWPPGLRHDPALADPKPDTRFDHLRWTAFNATHAWLPHDRRAAAPVPRAHREALQLVWERARAWALREWGDAGDAGDAGGSGTRDVRLVEGAWRWEPPRALRYRLLVAQRHQVVRQLEVARPLGAARLAPVPYVTESVRVTLLLPVAARHGPAAARLLRQAAALRDIALCVVAISPAGWEADWSELRAALPPAAALLHATADTGRGGLTDPGRLSLAAAGARGRLARDALVLLLHPRAELNDDFLNRVRMNTILGSSWYLPVPYARYLAPTVSGAAGARRPVRAGGFSALHRGTLAFYKRDFDDALAAWRGDSAASVPEVLAASPLCVLSAPDPALVLSPSRDPPCERASGMEDGAVAGASETACLRELAVQRFAGLQLGAAADLARLLLDRQPSPAA